MKLKVYANFQLVPMCTHESPEQEFSKILIHVSQILSHTAQLGCNLSKKRQQKTNLDFMYFAEVFQTNFSWRYV